MSHKKQKIRQRAGGQLPGAGGGKGLRSESLLGAGSPWGVGSSETFWPQGPVLWKTIFPQSGQGMVSGFQVHDIYCALYFC